MVAALAAIAASIVCVSRIFTRTADEAVTFALLLAAFLIALLPLSVQFVLQRTFYAHHDTRTPFLFTLVQALLVVLTAIIAWATLPLTLVAAGMALGQSLANIVQLVLAVWLLRRKIGPLGLRPAAFAYLRFLAAAVLTAGAGWLTFLLLGGASGWATASLFSAAASVVVIGVVTGVVYVAFLALLRAPELQTAVRAVRRFLPGR